MRRSVEWREAASEEGRVRRRITFTPNAQGHSGPQRDQDTLGRSRRGRRGLLGGGERGAQGAKGALGGHGEHRRGREGE